MSVQQARTERSHLLSVNTSPQANSLSDEVAIGTLSGIIYGIIGGIITGAIFAHDTSNVVFVPSLIAVPLGGAAGGAAGRVALHIIRKKELNAWARAGIGAIGGAIFGVVIAVGGSSLFAAGPTKLGAAIYLTTIITGTILAAIGSAYQDFFGGMSVGAGVGGSIGLAIGAGLGGAVEYGNVGAGIGAIAGSVAGMTGGLPFGTCIEERIWVAIKACFTKQES